MSKKGENLFSESSSYFNTEQIQKERLKAEKIASQQKKR